MVFKHELRSYSIQPIIKVQKLRSINRVSEINTTKEMKRKITIFLLTIFVSLGLCIRMYAQAPPNLDPSWEIVTSKSDEFNDASLDNTKWDLSPLSCGHGETLVDSMAIMDNGYLRLRYQKSGSNLLVGQIRSLNSDYNYGYFEISAKTLDPGNYKNGIPCATGLWPCFWLYYTEPPAEVVGRCVTLQDEIDIVETLYKTCSDVNVMKGHVYYEIGSCQIASYYDLTYNHTQQLFLSEHKYAAEWLPDRVILYFDDEPVGTYFGSAVPQNPLFVVLSMQLSIQYATFDYTISSPQDFKVDYFRYYELDTDNCTQNIGIPNQTQFNNLKGVYNNIDIGLEMVRTI
jgi:beta-glucanase (GH16 family)